MRKYSGPVTSQCLSGVPEHRGRLNADDGRTLQRIIDAAQTMSANVKALLALVRQSKDATAHESFSLVGLVDDVTTSRVAATPDSQQRVEIQQTSRDIYIEADRSLVRILLSNLINNALNHNEGNVTVVVSDQFIEGWDQAEKIAADKLARPLVAASNGSHGLGLYNVTLICEQLGWTFSLNFTPMGGTYARIFFQPQKAVQQHG